MKRTLSALLGILLITACQGGPRDVKIALAIPLTGDISTFGQGIRRSVSMAVAEAKESGRFQLFQLSTVEYDDRSDPKEAVNVANRIVADPSVVAVIGHFNSGCSIPASAIYARNGLPMISPAASNPELTRQQLSPQWTWPRSIFRVNTTDDVQGIYAAEFVKKELKKNNVAIVHDKTAYGQGVAEEFQKKFLADGGNVVSFDGIQVGDKDFKSLLTRIKASRPDVLYFGGIFNEGGLVVRQAREIGLNAVFIAGEANYDPEFLRIAGSAADGAYVTFLGRPPELMPTSREFVEKYKKRYPDAEIKAYDHYGYEAVSIVMDAVEAVGPDRAKIIEYLRSVHHTGVLGETSFDEKGDTMNKTVTLFRVTQGRFEPVSSPH